MVVKFKRPWRRMKKSWDGSKESCWKNWATQKTEWCLKKTEKHLKVTELLNNINTVRLTKFQRIRQHGAPNDRRRRCELLDGAENCVELLCQRNTKTKKILNTVCLIFYSYVIVYVCKINFNKYINFIENIICDL